MLSADTALGALAVLVALGALLLLRRLCDACAQAQRRALRDDGGDGRRGHHHYRPVPLAAIAPFPH